MTEIVLVAHSGLGEALCRTAESILADPVRITVFGVPIDGDREADLSRLADRLRDATRTAPALILTDLPGATPHNLACAAAERASPGSPVVTGVNLPMLLRALNHADRPAAELAELAVSGGRRSVFSGGRDGD